MNSFGFLFVVWIPIALARVQLDLRIKNGMNATDGQFPYQASLQYQKRHHCGGSIIYTKWILTAAHCFEDEAVPNEALNKFKIMVGSSTLLSATTYSISKIVRHEDYLHDTHHVNNDIALIQLDKEIRITPYVQTIKLETRKIEHGPAIVSGWGSITQNVYPDRLQFLHTEIIPSSKCNEVFRKTNIDDNKQLCVHSRYTAASCDGDSGGPLVADGKLVGVVSFDVGKMCSTDTPTVYTRVSYYYDWIQKQISQNP